MVNVRKNVDYGFTNALQNIPPQPIVSQRAPTANDLAEIGTVWVDVPNQAVYMLAAIVGNAAAWTTSPASGVGLFASITVNPGDIGVTAGDINITAGNLNLLAGNAVIAGDLTVNGVTTVNGDFDLTSAALIDLTSTLNAAPSILLHANGGIAESIELHSSQGTTATSINIHSDAGGVTLQGGLASADAVNILSGATGGIDVDYGSAGMTITGANGAFAVATGTGAINISADAAATTVNVGTGGGVKAVTVGSTNTTSSTIIQSGSGDVAVTSTDAILLDSAGVLELNSSAGVIGIGNDAVAQNINIGTGAAARVITIGNVSGASQVVLNSGTAGVAINTTGAGDVVVNSADTVLIDSAGVLELNSSAGVIGIGNDAVAQNINIGTGAAARVITIGNVSGASQVVLNSGTAGVAINTTGAGDVVVNSADTVLIDSAGVLELNSSAGVISIGNDAVNQNVNVGTAGVRTVTVGSTTGGSVTTIQSGTGGINLNAAGDLNAQVATDTIASPATTATIDQPLGKATFTGFTTAAGASQVFTISNAVATTTSAILCSAHNAGANDAQMTITRITPGTGTFDVTLTNNGAAALNGNVVISFWIPA